MNHIHFYLVGTEQERARWRQAHPDQYVVSVSLHNPKVPLINPWDQVVYCDSYYNQITPAQQKVIWTTIEQAKHNGRRVDAGL